MLEPSYFRRKNYYLTVRVYSGRKGYYWTKPESYDYEEIVDMLQMLKKFGLKWRYKFMGMVWRY